MIDTENHFECKLNQILQHFVVIGYSEGGMVAAISCSQNYENISSKINQVIGLGPILTFKSSKGQWSRIAKATSKISAEKVNKEFASGKEKIWNINRIGISSKI